MATGCSPLDQGAGVEVSWTIPLEIAGKTNIDRIRIYRSSSEDTGYELVDTIPAGTPGCLATHWFDPAGMRGLNYLVTFFSTLDNWESCFHITFFMPTPREARLIDQVYRSMPAIIQPTLITGDYLAGLRVAVQIFNVYPPQTYFTLETFPRSHEFFIVALAQMTALANRYLTISIRDFRYSEPGGVVMDQDRGSRINEALAIIARSFTQILPLVKLDFADDLPMGLGTVQLPLSMGGVISKGLLNALDIFTATGR